MSDLMKPSEWCELFDIIILDPDGWRGTRGKDWNEPISRKEFNERMCQSTVKFDPKNDFTT